jgi:hypothetical protein
MWVSGWPMMISYNFKILPIWIGSTRRAFGACTKIRHFPFSHGFMFILMTFLFPKCKWSEWDLGFFHHKDPNTYVAIGHALIRSQWAYFYGCHIWHQWCEVPPIHIDGAWFSSPKVPIVWVITCENLMEWLRALWAKLLSYMPHWKPSCFIVDDPHRNFEHCSGCTLIFYFLLHCLLFWYYVNMRIP